jgi:choline-sulfatase
VSYHHPHDPFQVTQELWDLYDGVDIPIPTTPATIEYSAMDRWANEAHETDAVDLRSPENLRALRRAYYALVTYVDRKLGELLDAVPENTLVVFTSDHGDMLGERAMVQKRCFYEWSARVPLLIRLPDGADAGTVVEAPVSLLDLAPTLLDLAAADERVPTDGGSLFAPSGTVFSEYHVEKVRAPCFMVRHGRWKYVYIHGHGEQLFDLDADPREGTNVAPDHDTTDLREMIFDRFDPDAIARHGAESVLRRDLIARAMALTTTRWDYSPVFDATKQYVR